MPETAVGFALCAASGFSHFTDIRRRKHAENAFICHSRSVSRDVGSAAAQGMCRDVTTQKNEFQEKLLSILLAAAAALLCAAIDHITKEDE